MATTIPGDPALLLSPEQLKAVALPDVELVTAVQDAVCELAAKLDENDIDADDLANRALLLLEETLERFAADATWRYDQRLTAEATPDPESAAAEMHDHRLYVAARAHARALARPVRPGVFDGGEVA